MLTQNEKKRLLIMGAIGGVMITAVLIPRLSTMMKARQSQKNIEVVLPEIESLVKQKAPSPRFLEKQQAQQALLKQDWGRNPFAKTDVKPEIVENVKVQPVKEAQFALEGIILRGSGKVALINGDFLREGETIQDALVKLIEQKRVVLEKNGKEIVLELEGS